MPNLVEWAKREAQLAKCLEGLMLREAIERRWRKMEGRSGHREGRPLLAFDCLDDNMVLVFSSTSEVLAFMSGEGPPQTDAQWERDRRLTTGNQR